MKSNWSFLILLGLTFSHSAKAQGELRLYPIVVDDKLGFIDSTGKERIPPQFGGYACSFRMLPQFSEGLARVEHGKRLGYIDRTGKLVFALSPQSVDPKQVLFTDGRAFHEGIAVAETFPSAMRTPQKLVWIDRSGNVIFAKDADHLATEFHEGLLRLSEGNNWGYVDHAFEWVIPPRFQMAEDFSEGLALVRIRADTNPDWTYAYIDRKGKIVFKAEGQYMTARSFSDGLALTHLGFVDHVGKVVIPRNFQGSSFFFSEGHAFACTDCSQNRMAIIDKQGKQLTPPEYDAFASSEFHEGLAAMRKGPVYGYIDPAGTWVIPPQFDEAYNFSSGLALVVWREKREWAYIDRQGRIVWKGADRCQYPVP
jgi:hypothetical protein